MCVWVSVCINRSAMLTLCDPMDCNLPGSSIHGIFQARTLEWVAMSSSRGSPWPKDRTSISCVFCIGRCTLYHCATREVLGLRWSLPDFSTGKISFLPPRKVSQETFAEALTPVFLSGESHGQRSLEGYSPWGYKESNMTEWLTQQQGSFIVFSIKSNWLS